MAGAQWNPNTGKESGYNASIIVREYRAQQNAAGVGIELVVQRLNVTSVSEFGLVAQLQFDGDFAIAIGIKLSLAGQGIEFEQRVFIHVRVNVDRIHGYDAREARGRTRETAHVIAF